MRRATSRRAVSWSTFSRWAQRSTRCSGRQVTTTSRSKRSGHAGLENERRLHQGNGVRIAPADFRHPFLLPANHGGMDDLIQFLDAGRLVGAAEGEFRQPGAVHAAIRVQNPGAEMMPQLPGKPPGPAA